MLNFSTASTVHSKYFYFFDSLRSRHRKWSGIGRKEKGRGIGEVGKCSLPFSLFALFSLSPSPPPLVTFLRLLLRLLF